MHLLLGFDSDFLVRYSTCFGVFESLKDKNVNESVLINIQISNFSCLNGYLSQIYSAG